MKHEPHTEPQYLEFIKQVVDTATVYTLQDHEDYYAECPSETYNNDLGEPEAVYCFWHSKAAAQACQQDEWANYELIEIHLADFMYENLIEMDKDQNLVGVSFDAELYGTEIEPIELLADLLDEIKRRGLVEEFEEFEELQNYREQWEQIAWQQQIIH
ncbi:DUF2750 domain-containing protein [Alysiella crassa]|uniref:Protein of uncharacterized function (DUF2750) n=1 Tax=Alysiella crassa TaxID=153491 RepID=A0A376BJW3_9NEIS|nr:DUF2750 domain-containing protein [Alysiella crassa]UOP07789.1 DUF2750 domain-containing protein [Alysiella crassa]SSY69966.1 Protein of uncharacterised function (DUF2750) [Alysiella crassa]